MIIIVLVSLLASTVGAISGIGGGVILKPVLDMVDILSMEEISFLSGCTVLSMASINIGKSLIQKNAVIDTKRGTPLAAGAALGGVIGKLLFSQILQSTEQDSLLGFVQAVLMLALTLGTLQYTRYENKINTFHISGLFRCTLVGLVLGVQSGFLGIGGGPANLVVLSFFFSMERKKASVNSLYIIFFSQLFSLCVSIIDGTAFHMNTSYLIWMVAAGLLGGTLGGYIYKKISAEKIKRIFIGMLLILIFINLWNLLKISVLWGC